MENSPRVSAMGILPVSLGVASLTANTETPSLTEAITPPPPLCKATSLSQTLPQGLIQPSVAPAGGSGLETASSSWVALVILVAQWSSWLCYFSQSTVYICLASGLDCIHFFLRTVQHTTLLAGLTPQHCPGNIW